LKIGRRSLEKVHSSDGTAIAFDRLGDGPPVVLVCGASTDRMANAPLAKLLAERFTVFNYDRRGRGDSDDTAPYAVEREVEDIGAVIDAAGGSAFAYGTSSGAALALEAAAQGLAVRKLALWEPPFILSGLLPWSRVVALAALIALVPVGFTIPALALSGAAGLIVVGLAVWETLGYRARVRSPRRSTP
jgi:pimeloyl-ACP methyl ester carboxylesterase